MASKKAAGKKRGAKREPTFEERLEALEEIVEALEDDTLSLEDSLETYRVGVEHLRACRHLLDDAEGRLVALLASVDGATREQPLRVGERGLEPIEEDEGADA